jgi:hypothetical protein
MRNLVSILFAMSLIAGPAYAQQNPWVPSGVTEPAGSLPNGDPAVSHHPWVPGDVYVGTLPNGAPAWAFSGSSIRGRDAAPRHVGASRHQQADTKQADTK